MNNSNTVVGTPGEPIPASPRPNSTPPSPASTPPSPTTTASLSPTRNIQVSPDTAPTGPSRPLPPSTASKPARPPKSPTKAPISTAPSPAKKSSTLTTSSNTAPPPTTATKAPSLPSPSRPRLPPPKPRTSAPRGTGSEARLVPDTTYHYRLVAKNEFGTTPGEDKTFTTDQPPTIEGFSSSHVTATSADLDATINPQGFRDQPYHFEYGTTTAYGKHPLPEKKANRRYDRTLRAAQGRVHIEDLQPGVTYHFRLVAENKWGAVTSEDQNFEFFPPACPNAAVRQQTGSAYLPDCRAYELVSPGNANGTLLYPGGPNTGQATSPSRFSFTGAFSSLPGADTIDTAGDLYVATRTDTGWVSRYIGLPGNQAGCMGGPPNSPGLMPTCGPTHPISPTPCPHRSRR